MHVWSFRRIGYLEPGVLAFFLGSSMMLFSVASNSLVQSGSSTARAHDGPKDRAERRHQPCHERRPQSGDQVGAGGRFQYGTQGRSQADAKETTQHRPNAATSDPFACAVAHNRPPRETQPPNDGVHLARRLVRC